MLSNKAVTCLEVPEEETKDHLIMEWVDKVLTNNTKIQIRIDLSYLTPTM